MNRLAMIAVSLALAGIFYVAWLVLFLLAGKLGNDLVKAVIWIYTPAVTAAGFALGLMLGERLRGKPAPRFQRVVFWPLAGCYLGAATVYWLGVAFITFGIFAGGTLAVIARDFISPSR